MQFKFATSIASIIVLVGVALALRSTSTESRSGAQANIKIVINQLPSRDGVVRLEIIQPTIVSTAPNTLDDLRYILRNNSGKAVIAAAVIRTITYEQGGKDYADSVYSTVDCAFHPDMERKPFIAWNQMPMEAAGPVSFDKGVIIKEITLALDYASYADQTADGAGGEGERRINAMREGARLYKKWLAQEYVRVGKSLATILPLIQTPRIPEEVKLNLDQTMGADRYRLHLLSTFQKRGAADVENYLKQLK
jgi:hypothetical protein